MSYLYPLGRPYTLTEAEQLMAVFSACTRAIAAGFDAAEVARVGYIAEALYARP